MMTEIKNGYSLLLLQVFFVFFISVFLFLPKLSLAAEGDLVWEKTLSSYGVLDVAANFSDVYTTQDYYWKIEKHSSIGALIWSKTDNLPGDYEVPSSISIDSTSAYIAGSRDVRHYFRVEKRNLSDGLLNWVQETYGGYAAYANDVKNYPSGIFVVGSRVEGCGGSPCSINWRVEKRSSVDGSLIWVREEIPPNAYSAKSVMTDSSGIYIGGYQGAGLGRLEKRNLNDGSLIWVKTGLDYSDGIYDLVVDSTGIYSTGPSGVKNLIEKRNLIDGSLFWSKQDPMIYTGGGYNYGGYFGLAIDSGGLFVSGYRLLIYDPFDMGDTVWRVEKRNPSDGSLIWYKEKNPTGCGDVADNMAIGDGIYTGGLLGLSWWGSCGNQQGHLEKRDLTSPPPTSPTNLSVTAASCSQIDLFWADNSNNETGFKIESKIGMAGSWSEIATVGADITNYSNTGLNASTQYYYRVRAYNTGGDSAYTNEPSATTPACVCPASCTAWSDWSSCSVSCGGGVETRSCTSIACNGYLQSQVCNTNSCSSLNATLSANPSSGTAPFKTTISVSSITNGTPPYKVNSYDYDCGGGTSNFLLSGSGEFSSVPTQIMECSYSSSGTYTVTVKIKDSDGNETNPNASLQVIVKKRVIIEM